jgi:hypothetical protein
MECGGRCRSRRSLRERSRFLSAFSVAPNRAKNCVSVLDPRTLIYLDYIGSGAETIAHLRENRRIAIMLCAFQGPPKIVRLHGTGEVLEPGDSGHAELRALFASEQPARAIIRISVDRISDSCGYGVPLHTYQAERTQLPAWAAAKGAQGLREYQEGKNIVSIDGLPALRWPAGETC